MRSRILTLFHGLRPLVLIALFFFLSWGAGWAGEETVPLPVQLQEALKTLRAELEWPGLEVEEAAVNLATPEAALQFVRDGVASVDYEGNLYGAEGALRLRAGNNTDKALLLAALLKAMGLETQTVSASWPAGKTPHAAVGLNRPDPSYVRLQEILNGAGIVSDDAAFDANVQKEEAALPALKTEVDAALAALQGELKKKGWEAKPAALVLRAEPKAWYWVRARKNGADWMSFDPWSDEPQLPADFQEKTPVTATVAFAVEVVDANGGVNRVLTWEGPSSQVAGFDLSLFWFPKDDRVRTLDDLIVPMDIVIKAWTPIAQIGGMRIRGKDFEPPVSAAGGKGFDPVVRLQFEVREGGKTRAWNRVLQDLGPGFDPHEWFAMHRLGWSVSAIPAAVVEGRAIDELLDLAQCRAYADKGTAFATLSCTRGVSTCTARIVNRLIDTLLAIQPDTKDLTWQGPALYVETTRIAKSEKGFVTVSGLDVAQHAFGPAPSASLEQKLRWGLAVCAAEAQLLKGTSVNVRLMEAKGGFQWLEGQAGAGETAGLLQEVLRGGGSALYKPGAPRYAWALRPDGELLGLVLAREQLQSKGGESTPFMMPETGGKVFSALAGAAASLGGAGVISPMIGGVAGYLFALRRAWQGITGNLQKVADAIASGDASTLNWDADGLRDMGKDLMAGFTKGFAKSYAEQAVTVLAFHHLSRSKSPDLPKFWTQMKPETKKRILLVAKTFGKVAKALLEE